MLVGLAGMAVGSIVLAALPGGSGVLGYVFAVAVITGDYALFQAANNTAVMANVAPDQANSPRQRLKQSPPGCARRSQSRRS